MKKLISLTLMFLLLTGFSVYAQNETGCEFQCKREYESSKFECSETWAGPGQEPNKENCMRGAENNLQRCRNTCDAG